MQIVKTFWCPGTCRHAESHEYQNMNHGKLINVVNTPACIIGHAPVKKMKTMTVQIR